MWQLNVESIPNAFPQQAGTIYWLGVNFMQNWEANLGWKTSTQHFNDDAVYWTVPQTGGPGYWQELINPFTGQSLDMAFVITPEPGTYALIAGLGLVAFAACRRFRA